MRRESNVSVTTLAVMFSCWMGARCLLVDAHADDARPYAAYVLADRSPVRSGPSDDHYVTDYLDRGDAVEVFRREGAWLGIRPPRTSFSWVAQRDVELSEVSGVARVVRPTAVSWIGSNMSEVTNHHWMITLDEGEPVSLLGHERRKMVTDGSSDVYYKIAPPSGEFRWLHEEEVARSQEEFARRDPAIELADFRVALQNNARSTTSEKKRQEQVDQPKRDEPKRDEPKRDEPKRTDRPATEIEPKRDDFIGRRDAAAAEPASRTRMARTESREKPAPLTSPRGDIDQSLRELDVNLSLIVAQSVDKWDLSPIRREAAQLAARTNSSLDRARIQVFLDKVEDFAILKSRHALYADPPSTRSAGSSSRGSSGSSGSQLAAREAKSSSAPDDVDPRFDGTGWLLPVHSTKRSAPPYALLDGEGNILHFVSPAPGLNLNRYLRKEIGVFGQKESASTLEKPHLTAHRVVELDRHRQ